MENKPNNVLAPKVLITAIISIAIVLIVAFGCLEEVFEMHKRMDVLQTLAKEGKIVVIVDSKGKISIPEESQKRGRNGTGEK